MIITHRIQLPSLMKELNLPLIGAECGTADGGSAVDFMQNGLEKYYCIDNWNTITGQAGDASESTQWHHKNLEVAKQRLSKWGNNVLFLRGISSEMAWLIPDHSLGMIYLDGDHSYSGVMKDLIAYFNKVVKGGIVAGHDFLQSAYQVKEAVHDFCKIYKYEVNIIRENKDEDAGFWFIKS